jgi:hypothetical protein
VGTAAVQAVFETTNTAVAAASMVTKAAEPAATMFGLFAPLLTVALNITQEVFRLCQQAEYNRKTCTALVKRMMDVEVAVRPLQDPNNNTKFFTLENRKLFKELLNTMERIRDFISNISKLEQLSKFQKWVFTFVSSVECAS